MSCSKMWRNKIVELLTYKQYKQCMFKKDWIEYANAAKKVSKSKRVHLLADLIISENTIE